VAEVKAADPLARVLVLVPTRRLAEHVLRRAAARFRALLGLDVRHHRALVLELLEEAGEAPALAPRAARMHLLERLLAALPGNAWSAYAAESPGATGAILEALDDLREAGIAPRRARRRPGAGRGLPRLHPGARAGGLARCGGRRRPGGGGAPARARPRRPLRGRAPPRRLRAHRAPPRPRARARGRAPAHVPLPFLPGAPATRYAEAFAQRTCSPRGSPRVPRVGRGGRWDRGWRACGTRTPPPFRAPQGAVALADVQGPRPS
jgi:hypothetical protein